MRDLINQINKLSGKVEDLYDENTVLRQRLGMGDRDVQQVDIKDVRMQKEATVAQLRSLNALLERQVCSVLASTAATFYLAPLYNKPGVDVCECALEMY